MSTMPLTQGGLDLSTPPTTPPPPFVRNLKGSDFSLHDRLNSIKSDSKFVKSVAQAYDLPLVANERCGSWYIPTEIKVEGVYFKSTDGHTNEWSFSLRRLNYQLLDVIAKSGGCIIVDSTRKKIMSDAFSKTIPIWSCVLNRALFPTDKNAHTLHTPPHVVTASEHNQIEKRLELFTRQFLEVCKPNIAYLQTLITRPLRPLWVDQESSLPLTTPKFENSCPVVLCTASRRVQGTELFEGGYVQGAADDQEAWSEGLTPEIFWGHRKKLLNASEDELPGLIQHFLKVERGTGASPILIKPTSNLFISSSQNLDIDPFDVIINCAPEPLATNNPEHLKTKKYCHIVCNTPRGGSKNIRYELQKLDPFLSAIPNLQSQNILICCPTGKEHSVGVALAILSLWVDDEGKFTQEQRTVGVDKSFIRYRLSWITTVAPDKNPTRWTLKSINAYLIPDPNAQDDEEALLYSQRPNTKAFELVLRDSTRPLATTKHLPGTKIPTSEISTSIHTTSDPSDLTQSPQSTSSVPKSLYTALVNSSHPWTFHRTLRSALTSQPSGTVIGTATFTPVPNITTKYPNSSLAVYVEEGDFTTTKRHSFTTHQNYVFRLQNADADNAEESLSLHFFSDAYKNKLMVVGALVVEIGNVVEGEDGVWESENMEQHLCGEDLYTARWKFGKGIFGGGEQGETWWELRYDVKGPQQDYVSETRYTTT